MLDQLKITPLETNLVQLEQRFDRKLADSVDSLGELIK